VELGLLVWGRVPSLVKPSAARQLTVVEATLGSLQGCYDWPSSQPEIRSRRDEW